MITKSLKTKILVSFFLVIFVLSFSIGLLGFYVIKKDIIDRAQERVDNDLKVARSVYKSEIDSIGEKLRLLYRQGSDAVEQTTMLDYARVVNRRDIAGVESDIVKKVFETAQPAGATRIIPNDVLSELAPEAMKRANMEIRFTPMARPTERESLDSVMSKEFAFPVMGSDGRVEKVVYGGKVINKDYSLVDRIRTLVYGRELYDSKPVGTVTIFQDDVRVSTNVLNKDGRRAVGTRVSSQVYEKVVEQGKIWHDRAFVVTDWYKTAYEPIRNIHGDVIGILYVGVLEKPLTDLSRNIIFMFIAIVLAAALIGAFLSLILAAVITRPLVSMVDATRKISTGEFEYKVPTNMSVAELNNLAAAFNEMAEQLEKREQSLKVANENLAASNKSYIDLISFVAHELNGILGSAIMNTYAVRDGFLGMVNFKQRKAIDSVARNLDYLAATVKKFLNLGRIERGELPVNKSMCNVRKAVFDASVESLSAVAANKDIKIENNVDPEIEVNADRDLLQVVSNNLVSNAIKYGNKGGRVVLSSAAENGSVRFEVYNDGTPLSDEQVGKLFRKFSRLDNPGTKKVKGNGLGLYITKNIIESHGGHIWVQPQENGNSFIFQLERGI